MPTLPPFSQDWLPPPKGWRERDARKLIPWVRRHACLTNFSRGHAALTNHSDQDGVKVEGAPTPKNGTWKMLADEQRQLGGISKLDVLVRVPKDEYTLRRALKSPRAERGGAVVVHEGDHWPTRCLKIREAKTGILSRIVGEGGQPRIWGQVSARGGGGVLEGVAWLYLTRASVKPTVEP